MEILADRPAMPAEDPAPNATSLPQEPATTPGKKKPAKRPRKRATKKPIIPAKRKTPRGKAEVEKKVEKCEAPRERKKCGRKLLPIDPKAVLSLAREWATDEEISVLVGCSPDTLVKRFSEALKKGRIVAKQSLRRHLWKLAKSGNAAVSIFMAKNHLGMKDNPEDATGDRSPLPWRD